jgi:hypothetical protein
MLDFDERFGGITSNKDIDNPNVLQELRLPHKVIDFTYKIGSAIGLPDKAAIIGNVGGIRTRLAGGDDQENIRPSGVHFSRQIHAVQFSGHLDIGEEQPHVRVGFKDVESGRGVFSFNNVKAVVFKHAPGVQPQELFVVDNQSHGMHRAVHHP